MQFYWLNKGNSENLIVFFAGWSFDYKPFEFLECADFDVIFVYDYGGKLIVEDGKLNNFKPDNILSHYNHKCLITWSMGSFVAYKMRDLFKDFDKKIAINGTPFPVDNVYGIPEKPFLLTLKHAKTGLEGKFYQNIFDRAEEYQRYKKTPVERTIENRVEELQNLYENIKNSEKTYEKFFDKALVSLNDKIIPAKNQLKFWKDFDVHAETLESGHFPYYNFKSWKELL
ncbi:DUF452 family protein [bacterium]|nr:DUF452 family protein [bacterium]